MMEGLDNFKKYMLDQFGELIAQKSIICPYCFEAQDEFEISGAYEEGEYEYDCQHCDKTFEFETVIGISYNIKPVEREDEG